MLADLEREFRDNWLGYEPTKYAAYLHQVEPELRLDLLIRLLSAEIEFAYQPPVMFHDQALPAGDEDDERVKPSLRLFLLQFPELRKRVDGVIQLSVLEYALRIRFESTPPNACSYIELCDREQERLGALLQLTERKLQDVKTVEPSANSSLSRSDTTIPEGKSEKPVLLDQLPCNLGCFLLIRQLGKGGMGNVYSAIDLRSTAHVAVKVMRHLDSWSIYRFVEEFSWLSQLNHPHLVKLYDAYSEGDIRYFSMEQVDGLTIRQWFQTLATSDGNRWDVLRQVLAETASALNFLHECEVIHRDVKPSNLMITPGRRAMLLDLGLAMRAGKARDSIQVVDGSKIVGTIQYLSPESLVGEPQTFASDWYSFGVLIYETVTNCYPPIAIDPKNGDTSARYRLDETAMHERLSQAPADLAGLCADLLRTDPKSRPSGRQIIERLGVKESRHLSFPLESCCLGREASLKQLHDCFHRTENAPALVLVRGESGIGKSTLVKHWTGELLRAEPNALLLQIRCHLQDHTPLRALNLLAQQLVTVLPDLPLSLWADLTESVGGEIIYGFPQMQQLVKTQPRPKDPSVGVAELAGRRAAGLHALLYWLLKLSQRRAVVMVIDDAHWADADSGRLLAQLFISMPDFRGMLVLVDQGEVVKSPLVESIVQGVCASTENQPVEVQLQPLSSDVCGQLLHKWSSRVGLELSPVITTNLVKRSGGNPFLLREVLSAYANHIFQIKLADEDWLRIDPNRQGGGNLRSRFSMLPVSMERVLQFLSIADEPLGFHQLQTVSRVMPNELLPLINYLASQGWIRINGSSLDSDLEIAHDRFRDIVLDCMPYERKQRRHYRLARTLSSESPPPWPRIAHHYWCAERFREAAACYMEAARSAVRGNAYVEALWFLEHANHPEADRSPAEQRNALRMQADCYAASGNSAAAIAVYEKLRASTTDPEEMALLDCLTGEQWIRAGKLTEALQRLGVALDELRTLPAKKKSWFASWHGYPETSLLVSFKSSGSQVPFTSSEQCLNRIGTPLAFLDLELGSRLVIALAQIAAERGTNSDRALAILRWAIMASLSNKVGRRTTLRCLRLGKQLARQSGNSSALALGRTCSFLWLLMQGRFVESLRQGEKALSLYQSAELANQWEVGFVQWGLLSHYWHLGQYHRLKEATENLRLQATQRADGMWTYWMYSHSAHLTDLVRDDVEQAARSLIAASASIDQQPFQSPRFFLWMSHVRQSLYEGDCAKAATKLQSEWPQFSQSSLSGVVHYAWLAYSLRLCCHLAMLREHPELGSVHRTIAAQCLKQLSSYRESSFAMTAEAQTLAYESMLGKPAAPIRWERAIEKLESLGFHTMALAVLWHSSLYLPPERAARVREEARNGFLSRGCANPDRIMELILPLPASRG